MEDRKNIDFDGIGKWSGAEKTLAEMLLQNTIAREDSMATHTIEQAKDSVRKWFIAWLITLAALVGTNVAWLYVWQSYEYVSQDGSGINSINTGNQEDIDYGADSQIEEEP